MAMRSISHESRRRHDAITVDQSFDAGRDIGIAHLDRVGHTRDESHAGATATDRKTTGGHGFVVATGDCTHNEACLDQCKSRGDGTESTDDDAD